MKQQFYSILFNFLNLFFKFKNRNKKKIYIYADSRGYDVIGKYGKSPFGSYILPLAMKYNVTYRLCPEKFTTIVDFIDSIKDTSTSFDHVIMHCGIVDFSPRPLSSITKVIESKKAKAYSKDLFNSNKAYYSNPFDEIYYNEKTITIYSKAYLSTVIGPKLQKIKNLIWIDSNPFVKGWEGNFTKGRPTNIGTVIQEFEKILEFFTPVKISLKNWDEEMIKLYTIDNIHFTKAGFEKITLEIKNMMNAQAD